MTPEETRAHAETERHDLIMQEILKHFSNVQSELVRFDGALAHIEDVYKLRTGT